MNASCAHIAGTERNNNMNLNSKSDSYASAGVDITAGYRAVELMKAHIAKTAVPGASTDIGGFGGLFSIAAAQDMQEPLLVSECQSLCL